MSIRDNGLFRTFLDMNLDPAHYVIAGSASLFVHGIRERIHDLDVVARGVAWKKAASMGKVQTAPFGGVHAIYLFDDKIEIVDGWFPDRWSVDLVIDNAEIIEGVRFLSLNMTLQWKRILGRDKDLADILALEQYLS